MFGFEHGRFTHNQINKIPSPYQYKTVYYIFSAFSLLFSLFNVYALIILVVVKRLAIDQLWQKQFNLENADNILLLCNPFANN